MSTLCLSLWKLPRIANTVQGLSQQQVQHEFLRGLSHSPCAPSGTTGITNYCLQVQRGHRTVLTPSFQDLTLLFYSFHRSPEIHHLEMQVRCNLTWKEKENPSALLKKMQTKPSHHWLFPVRFNSLPLSFPGFHV